MVFDNVNNPAFFQRPRELANPEDPTWYCNQVVSRIMLGNKMKNLSKDAKLSREYTNHSIRATSAHQWDCRIKQQYIIKLLIKSVMCSLQNSRTRNNTPSRTFVQDRIFLRHNLKNYRFPVTDSPYKPP